MNTLPPPLTDAPGDELLAARAQEGDQRSLEELYRRHHAGLRALIAQHVGNADDVNDIVQDAFVDLLEGLCSYRADLPFLPWMRSVCRHRMYKHFRTTGGNRRRHQALVDDAVAADDAPLELWDALHLHSLRSCLDGLSPRHRELLHQRYFLGLSIDQLANLLSSSSNSIMLKLSRLRSTLRDCISGRVRAQP